MFETLSDNRSFDHWGSLVHFRTLWSKVEWQRSRTFAPCLQTITTKGTVQRKNRLATRSRKFLPTDQEGIPQILNPGTDHERTFAGSPFWTFVLVNSWRPPPWPPRPPRPPPGPASPPSRRRPATTPARSATASSRSRYDRRSVPTTPAAAAQVDAVEVTRRLFELAPAFQRSAEHRQRPAFAFSLPARLQVNGALPPPPAGAGRGAFHFARCSKIWRDSRMRCLRRQSTFPSTCRLTTPVANILNNIASKLCATGLRFQE